MYCEQFFEFQIHFLLVGSELLLERRIYNHLKYEDRFMMILSGKFIREILDLPQTFNVLCKARTTEEMNGTLNEIAVFKIWAILLYHSNFYIIIYLLRCQTFVTRTWFFSCSNMGNF